MRSPVDSLLHRKLQKRDLKSLSINDVIVVRFSLLQEATKGGFEAAVHQRRQGAFHDRSGKTGSRPHLVLWEETLRDLFPQKASEETKSQDPSFLVACTRWGTARN